MVLFLYRTILEKNNKEDIYFVLQKINNKYFVLVLFWMLFGIVINLMNVNFDGSSRIAFQTARWYSFYRMLALLINPVIGLLLIHNLYLKNKLKLSLLVLVTIAISASAGSKSGFVFSFIMSFFFYSDLVGSRSKLSFRIYGPLILFVAFAALTNFYYLGVDADKIFERIVHYAEATIMVFPSSNPCSVCEKQSSIALLHRGFGRLFNDPSSLSDMNLFGFALSAEFYGGETMTGPNARIGAYSICAFPGLKIFVLYFVFTIVTASSFLLLRLTKNRKSFLYLSSIFIVIDTLQHFVIDYNVSMSNFTLIIFVYIFLFFEYFLKLRVLK
jgi:hypothetical protein